MLRTGVVIVAIALVACTNPDDPPEATPTPSDTYSSAMVLPIPPRWFTVQPDGCISGEDPRIASADSVRAVRGDFDGDGGFDDEFIHYSWGRHLRHRMVQVVFGSGRRATPPQVPPEDFSDYIGVSDFGGLLADEIVVDIGGNSGASAAVLYVDRCLVGVARRAGGMYFSPSHRISTMSCRGSCLASVVCGGPEGGIGQFRARPRERRSGNEPRLFRWHYKEFRLDSEHRVRRVSRDGGLMEIPPVLQGAFNGVRCEPPLRSRLP